MVNLKAGDIVIGSQRSGDFILPSDPQVKLGFIAGGIGVTPFVSQVASLAKRGERRDITMLYCVATTADLAYIETLNTAGLVVPVVGSGKVPHEAESGFLIQDILVRRVPDYRTRTWYISGPPVMVDSAYALLRGLGVPARSIKQDFFPGLA